MSMDKDLFDDLVDAANEMVTIEKGLKKPKKMTTVMVFDVKKIRERTGLSQKLFSSAIGISIRTLQDWEQKRRVPTGPAKRLLGVAWRYPETLIKSYRETLEEGLAFG